MRRGNFELIQQLSFIFGGEFYMQSRSDDAKIILWPIYWHCFDNMRLMA